MRMCSKSESMYEKYVGNIARYQENTLILFSVGVVRSEEYRSDKNESLLD